MTQPSFRPRLPTVPPAGALALGTTPRGQGRCAPDPALDAKHLPALPEARPLQPARDGGRAWLALNAASGWRREAALRLLDPPVSAFELAALLDRLKDWVPEVRRAARQRLVTLTAVSDPRVVAGLALLQVLWIEGWPRRSPQGRRVWLILLDHSETLTAVTGARRQAQGAGVQPADLRLLCNPALGGCPSGAVVWHAGRGLDPIARAPQSHRRRFALALPAAGHRGKPQADQLKTLPTGVALPPGQRLAGDRHASVPARAGVILQRRGAG